jgi:hypothetical protein
LFNLEEYESAKAAFEAGQALDTKNSTFKTWIRKCAAELDGAHSLLPAQAPSHDWFALILLLKVRYPIQCKPVQQVSMNLQQNTSSSQAAHHMSIRQEICQHPPSAVQMR